MTSRIALVAASVCACLLFPTSSRAFDQLAGKERIGVRSGGLITMDGLNEAYGNGWDLTLFFTERLTHHLLLDVRLGALYLGELKFEHLDDELLHQSGAQGSMRILYISLGPMVGTSIGGPYSMHVAAGAGIYSVSMVFTEVLTPFDLSDQKFGFNGGLGFARRISGNWSIEADGTAHYFLIEENINDLYFAFTDGADPPLIFDLTLGLTVDLR
jgi:opacity protein-like surface antigen